MASRLNFFLDLASAECGSQGWAAGGALQRLQPGRHQGGSAPGDGGCWAQAELQPRLTGDQ